METVFSCFISLFMCSSRFKAATPQTWNDHFSTLPPSFCVKHETRFKNFGYRWIWNASGQFLKIPMKKHRYYKIQNYYEDEW